MEGLAARKIAKKQPRDFDVAVGERVARLRAALGFGERGGQTRFAQQIGLRPNFLNMIERGERGLSPEVALTIRQLCGVTLEWLYAGEGGYLMDDLRRKLFPLITKK